MATKSESPSAGTDRLSGQLYRGQHTTPKRIKEAPGPPWAVLAAGYAAVGGLVGLVVGAAMIAGGGL